jgi:hypothetical protein
VNVGAQVCTFVHRASTGEPGWTATGAAGGRPEQPGYRRVEATVSIPASWATRSHHRRAHRAEWPATLRVELGEFGFDVHGDDAEEVDVLAVCWGDVGEDLIGHVAALGASSSAAGMARARANCRR